MKTSERKDIDVCECLHSASFICFWTW